MILSSNSSKCNSYGYKRIVLFLQNTIKTTRNLTAELYTTQYDNHLIGTYCKKHRSQSNRCRIRPYEDSDETGLNDLFWKQYSLGQIYCTELSRGKLELLGVNERGICNYFC